MLFYGGAGTGKTETCLQLAKRSGRKIMKVDIASTRTKWYGESENLLKNIFSEYASLCRMEDKTPILLFNEADAVFSSRNNIDGSHTDHRLQNILLEEMERMESGILIATTNMQESLDRAFERRFLFKLKFESPSENVRKEIWKSRMCDLPENDLDVLSKRYSFSGGEIENVICKKLIQEVIDETPCDLEQLKKICDEERLKKERISMGYAR